MNAERLASKVVEDMQMALAHLKMLEELTKKAEFEEIREGIERLILKFKLQVRELK